MHFVSYQINIDGLSPVQYAIQENCPFVAKLLLKYNCNLAAHAMVKRMYKCCLTQEDTHPHFALEPLFLALTHRSTEMLHLLIQCYWHVPVEVVKNLAEVFRTVPELNTHYTLELQEKIHSLFDRTIKTPRTLQEICRAVIREKLGSFPDKKVEQLPIAKRLFGFVLMEEYFGDLDEKIKEDEIAHPTDYPGFQARAEAQ